MGSLFKCESAIDFIVAVQKMSLYSNPGYLEVKPNLDPMEWKSHGARSWISLCGLRTVDGELKYIEW